jgi:hypothetical protein
MHKVDSATGISFYSCQGIDADKDMESNNLLFGHKHGKEIYVFKRWKIPCQEIMEGNYLMYVGTRGR